MKHATTTTTTKDTKVRGKSNTTRTAEVTHPLLYHDGAGDVSNSAFYSNHVMHSRRLATSYFIHLESNSCGLKQGHVAGSNTGKNTGNC